MDDEEASVGMLRKELLSSAAQQEGETSAWKQQVPAVLGLGVSRSTGIKKKDRKLQGKWLALVSPVTPMKIGCCCLLISIPIAAVVGLSVALSVRNPEQVIETPVYATCPRNWIGVGAKCFYFSEDMRNWTHSHASCVKLEAELAQFDSLEELNVLMRYKGASAHWIGLCRESSEQPWKWTDSTEYNNTVSIRGAGECAYLNDNGISSARKYIERKWICSKSNSYTVQCPIDGQGISQSM